MRVCVTDRHGQEHLVEAKLGDPLMLSLRDADLVDATCSGSCSCATCHVHIEEEWLAKLPASQSEENDIVEFLQQAKSGSRLACQVVLAENLDGIRVTIAQEEGF